MLGRLFERASAPTEERAMQVYPWGDWSAPSASSAGIPVTEDNSLNLLAVYGSVTLISDTIATLPRDVYRDKSDGTRESVTATPKWLEQPNSYTDIVEFLTQSLSSLLLDGNCYWAYSMDGNFLPREIHVLDPTKVQPKDDGEGGVYYTVNGSPTRARILHIRGLTRAGKLKGLSPVESARQSIGLGLGQATFAGKFLSQGTTMSGVVSTPDDLTPDQAKVMRETMSRDHGGLDKAWLPGVLTNGATWTQISVTPEQAQFLQSREFTSAEIAAQMFLLDPSMLGIAINRGQNLTYANLEQRGIHLVQFTLMRWIIRLERAFTKLLPAPQCLKFNVDALQRADLLTRYQSYRIALGSNQPFKKLNEIRDFEDDPPVPNGDKIEIVSSTPAPTPAPISVAPVSSNGKQPAVGATK